MVLICKKITESNFFHYFITVTILNAGVLVGIQTYHDFYNEHYTLFKLLDIAILIIFSAEVLLKLVAEGKNTLNYFKSGWNIFDFLIVALCLCEPLFDANAVFLPVLRLIRVLRILRLVSTIPKLQLLVGALFKSLPSMFYVGVLLAIVFYIYATMGVFIFAGNDPIHFRDLQTSLLTLFSICTLEGWVDIFYINYYGSDHHGYTSEELLKWNPVSTTMPLISVFYFISFICIGTMTVLNLVIGVLMNSINEMNDELATSLNDEGSSSSCSENMDQSLSNIELKMSEISDEFKKIKSRLNNS